MNKTTLFIYLLVGMMAMAVVSCHNDEFIESASDGVISPIDISPESIDIEEFFNAELKNLFEYPWKYRTRIDGKWVELDYPNPYQPDTVMVVNSTEHLASIYTGESTLPEIDFNKHSLILVRLLILNAMYVYSYNLYSQKDCYKLTFDLCRINRNIYVPAHNFYFWKIYPKLGNKEVVVEQNVLSYPILDIEDVL